MVEVEKVEMKAFDWNVRRCRVTKQLVLEQSLGCGIKEDPRESTKMTSK